PRPVPGSDVLATPEHRLAYPRPCRASTLGDTPSCTRTPFDPRLRRSFRKMTLRVRSIDSNGSHGRHDDALTARTRAPLLLRQLRSDGVSSPNEHLATLRASFDRSALYRAPHRAWRDLAVFNVFIYGSRDHY